MSEFAFIIQARMNSTRLPGKVLLPLPLNGEKPILGHIIAELQKVTIDKEIIVATSKLTSDDPIAEFCKSQNIRCHRGASENVLSRFQEIAEKGSYSHILRYTGDNPLVDISVIEKLISSHLNENADLTYPTGLPLGVHAEIVKSKCLTSLQEENLIPADKEHVTWFFKRNKKFKVHIPDFGCERKLQNIRATVDYPEDFILLSTLFSLKKLYKSKTGLEFLTSIYDDYPWIFTINRDKQQKIPPNTLKEELEQAKNILNSLDLPRAVKILNQYSDS